MSISVGTEKDSSADDWKCRFKPVGRTLRTVTGQTGVQCREVMRGGAPRCNAELSDSRLPRKATEGACRLSVPQTDSGGREEYSKALERTLVKELGKLTP